ncbi:hypothetical protein BST95_12725 [Halioglobus japonicus]|uniref:ATP-binding protein n=1 Tax=Halioglobus japonicus TaxID=930805 RepID=A0AAP8SPW4_9GAMM|nr:ATP-binding protein [Halioglobus japonicus]AQA18979.1 hypothetical protein BST95_12725 [Halioglobus japonicus]PLW88006.1 ATP-binding protein [Halioglobus japonicus]GHD20436.1 ATP-binding protein [Halioglobus japonicus]
MTTSANGLVRIICLDAHVPGKLMAIRVGEHANLSGTNGAGKTTLLKLAPLFYGANSTDLVPRTSNRTRFVDFYLPRPTSMIIYEYQTPRGLMCATVYRHTSGEKPAYRFLAEGFISDYFSEVREGERFYVEGRELGRHWKANHLEHSKQLEATQDYRAVIQGDADLIRRAGDKELRSLAIQFGLSGKIGQMRYLDKMATAILGRSGDMDRIKSMLAEIMQEDNVVPPKLDLHRGIRSEIASLAILRDLDKHEDVFQTAIAKGIAYQENAKKMRQIRRELDDLKTQYDERINEIDLARSDIEEELTTKTTEWENGSFDLKTKISDAKAEVETAESRLESLDKAYQRWEAEDIHTKETLFTQLDDLIEKHDAAQARLRRLEEGVSDIRREFDDATSKEKDRYHRAREKLQAKIQKIGQDISLVREKRAEKRLEITKAFDNEKERTRDSFEDELSQLGEDIAEARQASKHSFITDEEKLDLEVAEIAADDIRHKIKLQEDDLKKEQQKERDLFEKQNQADEKLLLSKREVERTQKKCDQLLSYVRPDAGSFLAALRENQSTWFESLGRVIQPELLDRKDLSPTFTDKDSTSNLFGWELDLGRIEKPEWATTLEDHERLLNLAEDELERYEEIFKENERDFDSLVSQWNQQKRHTQLAVVKLDGLKCESGSAFDAIRQIKARNRDLADQRKQEAKIQLERLEKNRGDAFSRRDTAVQNVETRRQSALDELSSQTASEESKLTNEKEAMEIAESSEKENHKERLKLLKQDFEQQRSSKGLEKSVLEAAESDLTDARKNVETAKSYGTLIRDYKTWLDVEWSRYTFFAESLVEAQRTRDEHLERYDTLHTGFKRLRDDLNSNRKRLEQELRTLKSSREECLSIVQKLAASPGERDEASPPRLFDIVKSDAFMLINERESLRKAIHNGVSKAETLILKGGEDSLIGQAWSTLVEVERNKLSNNGTHEVDEEMLTLNKTLALDELLQDHVSQLRESLTLFIENVGQQLINYYQGMKDISGAISTQSRQISSAIGDTLLFDAISEVKVSLKSRIDTEDYWPILEKFSDIWFAWKQEGKSSIPPVELDQQLVKSSDMLQRSNTNRPLSGLFELEISLCENNRWVTARRAQELEDASSTGLSYLILCCIYAGISRMLCRDPGVVIHWPMDELGTLAPENISRLFGMLDDHRIVMIGGFPTTDPNLLQHFKYHHDVQSKGGIVEMALPDDELEQLIAEREALEVVS